MLSWGNRGAEKQRLSTGGRFHAKESHHRGIGISGDILLLKNVYTALIVEEKEEYP
jgi:hypothetical protein